jgi:hypothetical protein
MGSTVKGVPPIRTVAHQVTDPNLRVADNTVVTATLTARGKHHDRSMRAVMYVQRQGAILSAIHFATPGKPSKEQKDMARFMARRPASGSPEPDRSRRQAPGSRRSCDPALRVSGVFASSTPSTCRRRLL